MGRGPCCQKIGLKRGRWAIEEDQILIKYIQDHGVGSWHSLPKKAGLLRCGKSCRLRWVNYLRTDLKRGNITAHEEDLIIKLHAFLGNRWSLIASQLSGRTDNEIKNHWNYHLRGKSSDVMGGPGNDNLPQHIIDNLAKLMAAVPNPPPAEKKRKKKSSLSKDKNKKLMKLTGDIIIIDKDKNKVDKPQTLEACEERLLSGSDSWSEQQFQNIVSLSLGEQEAVAGYRHEESVFQTPPFLVRDYKTSSLLPWNDNDIDMETNLMEQLTMLHSLDELIMEEDLTDKSICHAAEMMDTTTKQQHLPLVPSSFPSPTLISSCSSTFDQLLMSMSSDQLWTWEDHGYGVYGQGQDFVIEGGSSNSNSFMYV